MTHNQLKKIIRETINEYRVAGAKGQPGKRKVYVKGKGWLWLDRDGLTKTTSIQGDDNDDMSRPIVNQGENVEKTVRKIDAVIANLVDEQGDDAEYEYSFNGNIYYFENDQWKQLKTEHIMSGEVRYIIDKILNSVKCTEFEIPSSSDRFKRVEEMFDQFRGKNQNMYVIANPFELDFNSKPFLARVHNSIKSAKLDLLSFEKLNTYSSPDDEDGIKLDDEDDKPIDVDAELEPSFKSTKRYDESLLKRKLKTVIMEMISKKRK